MGVSQSNAFQSTSIAFKAYADDVFSHDGRRAPQFSMFTALDSTDRYAVEHDVMEALPVVREWVGTRQEPDVIFATVRGVARTWEKTFSEDRKRALSGAADGQLLRRLMSWLGSPDMDLDKIATDYLVSNPTGYDGVAVFSASHPRGPGGGTQSNTSATALSGAQHRSVITSGSGFGDVYGEPFGIQYDTLMVGPALAPLARELTGSTRFAAISASGVEATSGVVAAAEVPSANRLQVFTGGEMNVVVNPRFIGSSLANKYLYLDTSKSARPIVAYRFQGGSRVVERMQDTDQSRWAADRYEWAAEHDLVLVPGAWQVAFFGGP
jgi:phage major head subunit gpT-like protein